MWMRTSRVQRGRQCVVPEVSRTFHFGSSRAVNVNPYFQHTYFGRHAFYNRNAAAESDSGGTGGEYSDGKGLIRFKNLDKLVFYWLFGVKVYDDGCLSTGRTIRIADGVCNMSRKCGFGCRMTRAAYLGWMERKIVTESQLLDHSKWPCRKKKLWNSGAAKNEGVRNKNYRRSDEEFFIIDEMMNNDETVRSKKLFLLYIKMDVPNVDNRDIASVAWAPLAKVTWTSNHHRLMCYCYTI